MSRQTISDAMDRATSQIVRADYQFRIPGPRQRDHWERTIQHLRLARLALNDAQLSLDSLFVRLYGPLK